jgi:hypothetical protein
MTSRERMMAAIRLEEPDVFPIQIRGVRAWDEQWCRTRHGSYQPVIEAVREHGDYEAGWGAGGGMFLTASQEVTSETHSEEADDWIVHRTTVHTPAGDLTSARRTSTRGLPGLEMESLVKTLDDIEKVLSVPYEPLRPDCSSFFERDGEMGDRGIVMVSVPIPVSMVHNLMWSERLAVWSLTERETILRLTYTFLERALELLEHLISQGVGPVFATGGEEYVAPPLASPKDFHELVTEPNSKIGEMVHAAGGYRHVHCHGSLSRILEDFVEMGADCLHPVEQPPLGDVPFEEAKRRVGDRICLEGNIQIGDLYSAPTEHVVEEVRHAIRVGAPGGGFILAPSASPHTEVLTAQTVANYLAMIETAVAMRGG